MPITDYGLTPDEQTRRLRDERDEARRTLAALRTLLLRRTADAATVVRIDDVQRLLARRGTT